MFAMSMGGGALRRLMHTKVCTGLDIAHFLSLMYGFIMQQVIYVNSLVERSIADIYIQNGCQESERTKMVR